MTYLTVKVDSVAELMEIQEYLESRGLTVKEHSESPDDIQELINENQHLNQKIDDWNELDVSGFASKVKDLDFLIEKEDVTLDDPEICKMIGDLVMDAEHIWKNT